MIIAPAPVLEDPGHQKAGPDAAIPSRIAIVIPTLNEAKHISSLLRTLAGAAHRLGALMVVVDGGSTDGTAELVMTEGHLDF